MSEPDPLQERAQARVGSTLRGKWRLDRLLGLGGMAAVYAATHRNASRAAIKLLHPEIAHDTEITTRFKREGYVANRVDHPGTVRVLDDDVTEDGAVFLVMELLEGETVDARWERKGGVLPAAEVVAIGDQLLSVLVAAHGQGIVHRDLKPENLFLTHEGRLKVLDFGIARLRELSSKSSAATQAGSILGTPAFMAPEQALAAWDEVDHRTDLWAVGATLYFLLTGRFVHEAPTVNAQLVAAATKPARPVRELAPEAPEALAAVVDKALAFAREDRWQDAQSMRVALRESDPEAVLRSLDAPRPSLTSGELPLLGPAGSIDAAGALATLVAPHSLRPARAETETTARPVVTLDQPAPRGRGALAAIAVAALALGAGAVVLTRGPAAAPEGAPAASAGGASAAPPVIVTPVTNPAPPGSAVLAAIVEGGTAGPSTSAASAGTAGAGSAGTGGVSPPSTAARGGTAARSAAPRLTATPPATTVRPPVTATPPPSTTGISRSRH